MKTKDILILFIVSLFGCGYLSAQQSLFYYYKGNPIPLNVNSQHFLVYADANEISKENMENEYRITEWIEDGGNGILEAIRKDLNITTLAFGHPLQASLLFLCSRSFVKSTIEGEFSRTGKAVLLPEKISARELRQAQLKFSNQKREKMYFRPKIFITQNSRQ